MKFYHKGVQPELIVEELKKFYGEDALLETCLKYAWSNKPDVRISAIMLLGLLRNERALHPLLEISQEEEFADDVRKALVFMGRSRPESLLPLFSVENAYYRRFLARVAGEVCSEIYTSRLIDYLHDEDGHVRALAAKALSMIGALEAVPYIKSLLQDPYEDVQEAAVEALSGLKEGLDIKEVISWLKEADPSLRRSSARLLGLLRAEEAVHELGFAVKDSEPSVRRAAVEALRSIGSTTNTDVKEAAKRYLIQALTDEVRDIRVASVYNLGSIAGDDVIPVMRSLLRDRDDFIKVAAIKVLARLKNPSSVEDLLRMLEEPNGFVRSSAIEALSNFPEERVMVAIMKGLDDIDMEIKRTAIEALRGYEPAEMRILPFLRSEEWVLRMAAVKALGASKNPLIRAELESLLDREEDASIKNLLMEFLNVKGV